MAETAQPQMTELNVSKLQAEIIQDFLLHIGPAKDEMTKEDLELIKLVAKDAATLTVKSLAGADTKTEIEIVNATIVNLTIAKYFPVKDIFWTAVQRAGITLIASLVKAAISAAVAAV